MKYKVILLVFFLLLKLISNKLKKIDRDMEIEIGNVR